MDASAPMTGPPPSRTPSPTLVTSATELLGAPDRVKSARAVPLATGFEPLDDVLGGGFRAQDLVIVGGRPGVGKTVAALQWARWMAMQGQTAIYVSYAHSPRVLLRRLLALELASVARPDERIELPRLRAIAQEVALGATPTTSLTGDPLGEEAFHRLENYGVRLHLVRGSGYETDLRELGRVVADHRVGATALFVDDIDRIPGTVQLNAAEAHPRSVPNGLKELAIECDLPVIALATVDQAGLGRPEIEVQHLYGAADLSRNADVLMLVNSHRPHWTVVRVVKHRDGAADLSVQFRHDLANYRIVPSGEFVNHSIDDSNNNNTDWSNETAPRSS